MRKIPDKIIVPMSELSREYGEGQYFKVWTPEEPFVTHPTEDVSYIPESISRKRIEILEDSIEEMIKPLPLDRNPNLTMGEAFEILAIRMKFLQEALERKK